MESYSHLRVVPPEKRGFALIRSMTAFGRARVTTDEKDITVELKSVNNRYLDCSIRLPRRYAFLEDRIKTYIQQNGVSRGKLDVYIGVDTLADAETQITVDEAYAKSYIAALCDLRDRFGLADDISVMRVAADRAVFTVRRAEDDAERDFALIRPVLDAALAEFIAARETEGGKIERDLIAKMEGIRTVAGEIAALSEQEIAAYHAKFTERLKQLLGDNNIVIDENRVLTECAVYADRVAIDEELTRLECHFGAFRDILASGEPCGRKLDFLLQEINRETNTIGSKAQCLEIAKRVVHIKAELEKIREQIQNIE